MANNIELLLEAEKRGILPDDKKELLTEARKRGLVPQAQGQPQQAKPTSLPQSLGDVMGMIKSRPSIAGMPNPIAAMEKVGQMGNAVAEQLDPSQNAGRMGQAGVPAPISAALAGAGGLVKPMIPTSGAQVGGAVVGGEMLDEVAQSVMKGIGGLGMKIAPELLSKIRAAANLKVPLSPAETFGGKPLSALESTLEKTPLGGGPIREFRQKQINVLKDVRDSILKKYGNSPSALQMGKMITDAISSYSDSLYNRGKAMFADVAKEVPPGVYGEISTDNLRGAAKDLLAELRESPLRARNVESATSAVERGTRPPVQPSPEFTDEGIISTLQNLQNSKNLSWEAAQRTRQELNSMIDKESAQLPISKQGNVTARGRDIYKLKQALDQDIQLFSEQVGGKLKTKYDFARSFWKVHKDFKDNEIIRAFVDRNPEDVAKLAIQPGAITEIKTLKRVLPAPKWQVLKRQFVENLIGDKEIGVFSPTAINKQLSKYGDETLEQVFTPSELKEIRQVGSVGSLLGRAEKLAGNASGTAQNVIAAKTGFALLTNPVKGTVEALGPRSLAQLYLSPTGRKLLTTGLKMDIKSPEAISLSARILGFLGGEKSVKSMQQNQQPVTSQ